MRLIARMKEWAGRIKRDVVAVYFAARDPRTPIYVRLLALAVAAYALSPIDLIPDFIPVIGYLDDLLVVPLSIWLIVRAIPPEVLLASRAKAEAVIEKPRSVVAGSVIVLLWLLCAVAVGFWLLPAAGI